MTVHRNTALSVILSVLSVGITFYQYQFTPSSFDYRIIAGVVALLAFVSVMSEFEKYTSNFQFSASFFAIAVLGISIDQFFHVLPYITISAVLVFLAGTFRMVFRRWFSESDNLWIDPILFFIALALFVYGNISNNYGWRAWVFPAPIFVFSGKMIFDMVLHGMGTVKYVSGKKLIYETGKTAPDFCLPDDEGIEVKLSDYAGKRDVLLMFVRSAWCPSCHIMLRTYQRNSEKFKTKNVLLFAIGPNASEENKQMAIDLGIDFKVLSDEGQKTAMAYRVHLPTEFMGEKFAEGMPLPASFLIDKKGIIRYTSRPDRIGEFFAPETIFPILESLN